MDERTVLPREVLDEIVEWKRSRTSGTIEISFHEGILKTYRPSPVLRIGTQKTRRSHLQVKR